MEERYELRQLGTVERDAEDESADGVRHEADSPERPGVGPQRADGGEDFLDDLLREEVETLHDVAVALVEENALDVGVGERDEVEHAPHVLRVGFEAVENEDHVQRRLRSPVQQTLLAEGDGAVVQVAAGRVGTSPGRGRGRGRLEGREGRGSAGEGLHDERGEGLRGLCRAELRGEKRV